MKILIHQCKPKDHPLPLFSWAIRFFQRSEFSHYAIQFESIVLDASGEDVRFNHLHKFTRKYTIVNTFEMNIETDFRGFVYWSMQHMNKSYGLIQVFGQMFKILGITKKNKIGSDEKRLTCNELVMLMLRDFKGETLRDTDDYDLFDTDKIIRKYI
jgi:hypothetical protein